MKKLISLVFITIFLGGNMAVAEGTDFKANSTMSSKLQSKNLKSSTVQQPNARVYFQNI